MKAVFLTTFCISLHVGSIESYYLPQHQIVSRRNTLLKSMPGMGGPESGFQGEGMPNAPQGDFPQGPMPGAPMVPMGPGGPESQRGGGYGQSYGGTQGYRNGGGGYSNGDNWYDSPHDNWNAGGGTGWNNQGSPGNRGGNQWWNQPSTLQGNSRKTWSAQDPWNQRSSHIHLQSERPNAPLDAKIDYLHGPGNVARQMKVWSMDGYQRPVRANFANPSGGSSRGHYGTMDVKNTGPMEFPISAGVSQSPQTMGYGGQGLMMGGPEQQQQMAPGGMSGPMRMGGMAGMKQMKTIQGESLKTFSFDPSINFVQIDLETDGMPCYADIEVSQGPGEARQTMQVYSDDGSPWEGVVELPGYGSTITIKNAGPMAYPIKASCEPIG